MDKQFMCINNCICSSNCKHLYKTASINRMGCSTVVIDIKNPDKDFKNQELICLYIDQKIPKNLPEDAHFLINDMNHKQVYNFILPTGNFVYVDQIKEHKLYHTKIAIDSQNIILLDKYIPTKNKIKFMKNNIVTSYLDENDKEV